MTLFEFRMPAQKLAATCEIHSDSEDWGCFWLHVSGERIGSGIFDLTKGFFGTVFANLATEVPDNCELFSMEASKIALLASSDDHAPERIEGKAPWQSWTHDFDGINRHYKRFLGPPFDTEVVVLIPCRSHERLLIRRLKSGHLVDVELARGSLLSLYEGLLSRIASNFSWAGTWSEGFAP